jgi:hypothetical protein
MSAIPPSKPTLFISSGRKMPTFLHVKFEASFSISLQENSYLTKCGTNLNGIVHPFSKAAFKKICNLLVF